MKRIASLSFRKKHLILIGLFLALSCGKNDLERNPYFLDLTFSLPINLNLPQYDNLRFPGGTISTALAIWLGRPAVPIICLRVVPKLNWRDILQNAPAKAIDTI